MHLPSDKERRPSIHAQNAKRARLRIACPDRPGIVAGVSTWLASLGANIVQSHQHSTHPESGLFFMRVEFDLPGIATRLPELEQLFLPLAQAFQMEWQLTWAGVQKRIAIFVSKELHCLSELLWQWQVGDLDADLHVIVSNHRSAKPLADASGIPFHHIPVTPDTKAEAERSQLNLVKDDIDLVVLARYMQILSGHFVQTLENQIINIHHSFLPAFIGRDPYTRAYNRGVKLIGATAHYVTESLDEGPIIEQDVDRVYHGHDIDDLKRIGRHVERTVLARAVAWHVEDKILVHENKTIVFA